MGRPPKYSYPKDDEIVALISETSSMRRAAQGLGIPDENLRLYINRRPDLKLRVYAQLPPQHNYPSDTRMVQLMGRHRSYKAVAEAVGVKRKSLSDYLDRRPELKASMEALRPPKLTPEERKERIRESGRRYAAKQRHEKPEEVRAARRAWARNQPPENRAKWNNYNRLRRKAASASQKPVDVPPHLYRDPCSYCGSEGGTVDHIEAIHHGGDNDPSNYTAACQSCNAAKGSRFTVLGFLLYRR